MHQALLVAFSLSSVATLANVEQPSLHHNCDVQLALCLINAGRMSEIDAALGAAADSKCGRAYAICRKNWRLDQRIAASPPEPSHVDGLTVSVRCCFRPRGVVCGPLSPRIACAKGPDRGARLLILGRRALPLTM
jgi:hypothetical protein